MKSLHQALVTLAAALFTTAAVQGDEKPLYLFNRAPLREKPYAELPLGAVRPDGWLRNELERMADGMTGHLDQWYPEVCGPRNAWLGGEGDTWERGPYWIDGLYPLARILGDEALQKKAQAWVDWTLEHQREDGYIGPVELNSGDRTQPPPAGAQIHKPDDWWPRMVMLKILQQHYNATGDPRVVQCLEKYFRYQLQTLPGQPLEAPPGGKGGSWWAAQRGGDNLMVVLWLYNLTGQEWLLELAELVNRQTIPVTDWFLTADRTRHRLDQGDSLHCVNLAQMTKTPVIRYQQDQDPRNLEAVRKMFADVRAFHGQPQGLYGADEGLHGDAPDRGSELCSAVEMMFSLEKMLEITGDTSFADRLERVAFNALPTQCLDDHRGRQYFQQTNQVQCTFGNHDFFNDEQDRLVYGLLQGYPCCTCNLHQGWPKFTQHLWMASADRGLAALVYAPSRVTAKVADGTEVTITEATGYPFFETVSLTIQAPGPVEFPLHLRIPGWCSAASLKINGEPQPGKLAAGSIHVVRRQWKPGDRVDLALPMPLVASTWYHRSKVIERGPLVFALDIQETWTETPGKRPDGLAADAMHRGYFECRPASPWNYALSEGAVSKPADHFTAKTADAVPLNPWTRQSVPVSLEGRAVRLPYWTLVRNSAANPPLSPVEPPQAGPPETIRLIPYGATTLRITEFPWVRAWPR
ncbi:MAG: beta-L-arabinofuranosidase domain-containing protein [Thermoguttaceae bacterium]